MVNWKIHCWTCNSYCFSVCCGARNVFILTNQKNPFPSAQNGPWHRLDPTTFYKSSTAFTNKGRQFKVKFKIQIFFNSYSNFKFKLKFRKFKILTWFVGIGLVKGVGQSVRSLKCPGQSVWRESQSVRCEGQSVRRESQSVRGESQSVRGRSPPRSMCYKHRRSRPSGTYEPLAVGSIETYIFYFYLTSIHIIYKVAKPNHNVVGPGRID